MEGDISMADWQPTTFTDETGNNISDTAGDLGVNLAGGIGGSVGQAIGAPFGGVGAPVGGAALGGVSQGGAEAVRELLSGKGLNFGNIASQFGQGAAWGAVPGGEEARTGAMIGKAGLKALGKRALAGGLAGTGVQAIQNVQQGKPIQQNLLQSGGVSGALNALAPGVSKVLGVPTKFLAGSSEGIRKQIAKFFVGEEASRDPSILQHLDYTDPIKSRDKLNGAAQNLYAHLTEALSKKSVNFGDFMNTIKSAVKNLPPDPSSPKSAASFLSDVENYLKSKAGSFAMLSQKYTPDDIIQGRVQVPLNFVNDIKQSIGKSYGKNSSYDRMYSAARKFIEDAVGGDAPTAEINKSYNRLTEAADFIDKNFAQQRMDQRMGKPLDWIARMALGIGTGMGGAALGFAGTGSPYSNSLVGATFIASALKDLLLSTPQKAAGYANFLDKVSPPVRNALQQLLLRGGNQAVNQGASSPQ